MKTTDSPIAIEQTFSSSRMTVWNAITEAEQMKKWFFPRIESFEPTVGFTTQFTLTSDTRIFPHLWTVTEVIPEEKITCEWRYGGYQGAALVSFVLSDADDHTLLTLTSAVLENFPTGVPEFKRESALAGWQHLIKTSLKEYLHSK